MSAEKVYERIPRKTAVYGRRPGSDHCDPAEPEGGCPWDKVQTRTSIRMNFLEEAYEAVDAIDLNDPELLCEELGDVMMQVVFHAQIEREAGHFTFDEVCDGVCRKLIERHPHIFGGDESIKDWDSLRIRKRAA